VVKTSSKRAKASVKPVLEAREPKLSEQNILDGALRLIRADGVEQLSMRKLADDLGVSPMACYYYVKNKDDLLERIYDSMLATVATPAPSRVAWREQLRQLALALYELFSAHPGLSGFMLGRLPTAEGRRIIRHQIEVLLAAGFDERRAALGVSALNTMIVGTLASQVQLTTHRRALSRPKKSAPPSTPIGRVAAQLGSLTFAEWSAHGLDAVLDSLARERIGARKR
jgi:TetR/AcrR family tetracycline transcriptional repressor